MNINGNQIKIFDPDFAYNRIREDECGQFYCLGKMVENYESPNSEYTQGQSIIHRERDYHKYPNNVAVVFERKNVFKMQTFSNGRVGKLYENIITDQNEIREFFENSGKDLIVLESNCGRTLSSDFDNLLAYVNKILHARSILKENRAFIYDYVNELNRIIAERDNYIDKKAGAVFNRMQRVAEDFLSKMQEKMEIINLQVNLESEQFFVKVPDDEKRFIIFGLYYCFLKKGLINNRYLDNANLALHFGGMLKEMHEFVRKNPNVVEDYCDYMEYPKNERETIKHILHREGITRDRWIFAADDLL